MSQKSFTPENTYFANVYTSNALFVYHFDGKCKGNIVRRDVFFSPRYLVARRRHRRQITTLGRMKGGSDNMILFRMSTI